MPEVPEEKEVKPAAWRAFETVKAVVCLTYFRAEGDNLRGD